MAPTWITLLLSSSFATIWAFPNGAPFIACGPMIPAGHLPTTVKGDNPFMLNISATSYKPGDIITGTLSSPTGDKFRGFLIEVGTAASVSEEEKGVGEFTDLVDISKHVCGQSGITHISRDEKDMVEFTWKAPDQSVGDLSVRATVVQQYFPSKYWLGAFSTRIRAQ